MSDTHLVASDLLPRPRWTDLASYSDLVEGLLVELLSFHEAVFIEHATDVDWGRVYELASDPVLVRRVDASLLIGDLLTYRKILKLKDDVLEALGASVGVPRKS